MQTGQPFVNADGSVYRYDPDKPFKAQSTVSAECQTDQPAGSAAATAPANAASSKAESCSEAENSSGVAAGSDSSTSSEKRKI